MPSSDREPALSRGYFAGLIGGCALLGLYCLLNVLVDPTGEFGLSGRFAFNLVPPPAAMTRGMAGGNPAFYGRTIRESDPDAFLVGQSRTWRGFDTCRRSGILRIAGSAWGISELARTQRMILQSRRRPITLMVEIGLPQDERNRVGSPLSDAISVGLSPRTAWLSLQTVAGSLAGGKAAPSYVTCRPLPSPPTDWEQASRTLQASMQFIDATPDSLRRGRLNVVAMADEADRICARSGIRHRLIYFSLPSTPARSPALDLDRVVRLNSRVIAAMLARRTSRPDGCTTSYRDFTSSPPGSPEEKALWRDRGQWSDYGHYSPRLGDIALTELLRQEH
jgi:hypothetical protein